MKVIISIFIYLIILFAAATLLFISLNSIWETSEPMIAYLLSLIIIYFILNTIGDISKRDKGI
ncbi:hypothetical protein ACOQFO_09560 [Ureibacillus sp. MALMAid1270]|uniref:hypothetical protein n=1 Tax=Ureibacillus sp. MALMAid1270 TaxID=3411629 RepID=UPI003BA77364